MKLRESTPQDEDALRALHEAAFGPAEGPVIAELALDLLHDASARPLLSLVAEGQGRPVGHVIFSALAIDGHSPVSARLLAPLAVAPGHQGRGIGGALIAEGLARLAADGIALVLGDPRYYTRSGFRAGHAVEAPYPLAHPEAWMARELAPGVLARVAGVARCAAALDAPRHW